MPSELSSRQLPNFTCSPQVESLRQTTRLLAPARAAHYVRASGRVTALYPSHIHATGLSALARLGDQVSIDCEHGSASGEIVLIQPDKVTIKLFSNQIHARLGARVTCTRQRLVAVSDAWKGRIIDAFADPLDGKGPLPQGSLVQQVDAAPPDALDRSRIDQPLPTGIVAIDVFTPLCTGQRIGLFAGSGVGKSTLLAMLANVDAFDVAVVALVGERGREVREFVEDCLGDNLKRAVVVVATSDESALTRRRAPLTAMAVAEHFRRAGQNVLMIVDSITRYAHACRDVAMSTGEPPVSRGYPPSTFAEIAKLLERAGPGRETEGSITAIFSVLLDGDSTDEPVADTVRGILDGHIMLSRKIAQEGRYPAIDILNSTSRLADRAWTADQRRLALKLVSMIERYEDTRDIRMIGGYKPGSDPELDECVLIVPKLMQGLSQTPDDSLVQDAFARVSDLLNPATPA